MSSDTTTQPEQESGAVTSLTRNTCWNLPAPYPGHRGSTYEQMSLANGSNPSLSASANGDSFFSAVQSRNIEGASVNPNITAVDFSNAGAASSPSSSVPDDPTPLLMGPDKRYKCDKCSKTYTAKHNLRSTSFFNTFPTEAEQFSPFMCSAPRP
ncbi:hypothetical protein D9757_014272 [Collybiopsis confluens]|uniref:Uncharacterized protein n=1 Tax=Collybiopsis confluens TaxID=2823264 RepID=A0A8H5CR13_9AGAR|nr:hypothetical protein D9757_014272 [Collybiopsis confluens]